MGVRTVDGMGFVLVSCATADVLRRDLKVLSSMTDMSGEFGEPEIFTEWGIERTDGSPLVVMREHRWPRDPARDCEHWVPAPGFDYSKYHDEGEDDD